MASQGGKGSKKIGRYKKKSLGRTTPLSSFVRGKITAEQYWHQIGLKHKKLLK